MARDGPASLTCEKVTTRGGLLSRRLGMDSPRQLAKNMKGLFPISELTRSYMKGMLILRFGSEAINLRLTRFMKHKYRSEKPTNYHDREMRLEKGCFGSSEAVRAELRRCHLCR